eukprot:2958806-Amphidinium_carterae.1
MRGSSQSEASKEPQASLPRIERAADEPSDETHHSGLEDDVGSMYSVPQEREDDEGVITSQSPGFIKM